MTHLNRRDFLRTTTAAALGAALLPPNLFGEAGPQSVLVVVHGKDIGKMLEAGISKLGGWNTFIRPGARVTLKPNAAWASTPEQGGNTDPLLVGQFIATAKQEGAAGVNLPENPCSPARQSFSMSGIAEAAKKAGGKLYQPKEGVDFRPMDLPKARVLKTAEVANEVLDCDWLVNMPVAKSHSGSVLTLSMKNWMGSVADRGFWHRNNLHQCIADCSTLIKPGLIILDATRIMVTRGPRGPGKMEYPGQLVFGRDPVAVDAYASTLFGKAPFDIPYIQLAHTMGVGCGDLKQVAVEHVTV